MKTIADHILDIVQNSIRAKATLIEVIVVENKKKDFYNIIIKDNGCGMDEATRKQATNPFFTSRNTRKVGLGLSLLKQNAEQARGIFQITSEVDNGTEVNAVFQLSNVDKPPLGDIWNTYYFTLISNPKVKLNYRHETEDGVFEMLSEELEKALDGVSLLQKEIKEAIIEMIKNNLKEIKATN
jgi:hypothetical protein